MSGQVSVTVNGYRKLAFKPLVWFSSSRFHWTEKFPRVGCFLFPAGSQLALGISRWQGVKAVVRKLDE